MSSTCSQNLPARKSTCSRSLALRALLSGSCLLAASAPSALAQWSVESPLPTNLQIRGVASPAPGRIFVATEDNSFDDGGALFESIDGGTSWIHRDIPLDLHNGLNGITFLDSQRGWVWGNVNYRTLDGGTTWEQMPLLGSAYFMQFHTADFGVTSGNFGVYVSRDGGLSWAPSPDGMSAFSFVDAQTGLGASASGIFRTTDGGTSFASVLAGEAVAVTALSSSVAVAIVDGIIFRSSNGGSTWTAGASASGRNRLLKVSADVVLAYGRGGTFPDFDDRILRSDDGGQTWIDLGEVIPATAYAADLNFTVLSASIIVASDGSGNLYRSIDAGLSWSMSHATPGPSQGFFSNGPADFVDAQTGYIGYGSGYLLRSDDGGASWTQISSGSGIDIMDMDRFSNGDLIAVGTSGQVLTRSAGSTSWTIRGTLGEATLEAVQVTGPQQVVAVGRTGTVHRSEDGGATWQAASSAPASLTATDLHFEDLSNGWVIGQGFGGAALFHTTDAGATWNPVTDFQGTYVAVDFAGASGWAASYNGTVYRTIDAGNSWSEAQIPGGSLSIRDLDFWDASTGYAVGSSGFAARSSDGGQSWQTLSVPDATDDFTDIALIGSNELWLSTAAGKLLYSANGGQNWAMVDSGGIELGAFASLVVNPAGDAWIGGSYGAIHQFAGPPGEPLNNPPLASFGFATTGLSVVLTDTSTDSDGTISTWLWNFGDGSTSSEQNPVHVFELAGTYPVSLSVTDDDGDTDVAFRSIVVQPGPGGIFGEFTEITPLDPLFVTPQDEDFYVSAAAPADFDGDGDLDIAVLGYYVVYNVSVVDRLVLMRNDGALSATEWDFTYLDVPLGSMVSGDSDLAWGDADGDGDQDLVIGSNGETVLYRNDAGTLVPTDTVLPGYWEDNSQADFDLRSISWADYDNDGDQDLLVPSVWDEETFVSRTALLRNDGGNGSGGWLFTEVPTAFGESRHTQTSWSDFDGDQDLDVLIVHLAPLTETGFIRRYRNEGDGSFTGEDILGSLSIEHGEAQWGDYDSDGDLDILVAGNVHEVDGSYDTVLRVYRNDNESFVPVNIIDCAACEGWFDFSAATWADYDSDGDIDILLAGTWNSGSQIDGRAKIYDNVGGTFVDSGNQLPAPRAMGFSGGSFGWLDLDGEGDLDYFIAGSYFVPGGNGLIETQMHVYRNTAPAQNQAPSAPASLVSEVDANGSVVLGWNPGNDDLTPVAALTYEVSIHGNAIPGSTARRSPEPGSMNGAGAWSLSGLADGSYLWSVRAVDSAYNSSPAAIGVFRVGPPPPDAIFAHGFETP